MPEQMKNPVILPKDTRITWLIILKHHKESSHSGPELTLRNVRLQYWVPGGKRQIRKGIKLCGHRICKYPNPQGQTQQIANLPTPRITPGNFRAISVDFAGPFRVKKCGTCKNQKVCQGNQASSKDTCSKDRPVSWPLELMYLRISFLFISCYCCYYFYRCQKHNWIRLELKVLILIDIPHFGLFFKKTSLLIGVVLIQFNFVSRLTQSVETCS